ncbi:MAG: Hsp20/alpha crystallin family protein [Sphingobacteriales bacterium]|nr:Hsp20/alpha crystallin family protein [Sphingobacteriales bacterium]MBI3717174.1 Hsp20/alpha crystallin family protein [Sphingobacteriales bacterium]
MATRDLMRFNNERLFPTVFNDFFKPWNEWFDSDLMKTMTVPSVNVIENDKHYKLTMAAPGLKKDDFKIDIDGDIITISAETKVEKEEKDEKFSRKEYSYKTFSRSFTLPEIVNAEKIDAVYENGELKLMLPKKAEVKKTTAKNIAVH